MKRSRFISVASVLLLAASSMTSPAQGPGPWKYLGPEPIKATKVNNIYDGYVGPMPIAGRVSAVAVADADTIYIGTSGGGVWKTSDGGMTWKPKTDTQANLTIGAITLDPTNKNVIYAGTGEFIPYYDEFNGIGVLRSADAGETWTLLPDPTGVFNNAKIARLAVDPTNPSNIYAATSVGLAVSADSGQSWSLKKLGACSSVTDVVVDESSTPGMVYAAASIGDFSTSAVIGCEGIWKASTSDNDFKRANGQVFMRGGKGLPVGKMSYIRLAKERFKDMGTKWQVVLYTAMSVNLPPGASNHVSDLKVYKSYDGGSTWLPLKTAVTPNVGPFQVAVQRKFDASRRKFTTVIYVLTDELFVSKDDGDTWKNITSDPADYAQARTVHHDMHGLDFIPDHAERFFLGTDGGIYKSDDYGESYTNLNDTLGNVHFYRGAVSNDPTPLVIGSMHDSGFVLSNGKNKEWTRVNGGDGGSVVWDPQDTKRVYMTRAGDAPPLAVYRSTSGGEGPYQSASKGLPATGDETQQKEPFDFLTPLVMDPKNPKHLYVASNRLYTSVDGADTWQDVGPPVGFPNADSEITAVGLASDSAYVHVYAARGLNVFKYVRQVPSFLKLPGPAQSVRSWSNVSFNLTSSVINWIKALAVDPQHPNVVYAGLWAPSGQPHVMKLADGKSWVSASLGLPDANVNSIVINPNATNDIFAGTDEGVYRSINGGDNWFPVGYGMPNAIIWDVVLDKAGTTLYVFTHGRGVWKAGVKALPVKPPSNINFKGRMAKPAQHVYQIEPGIFAPK
ncbi:MAG TPA: hypothetical protein VM095_17790 [Pyrinomonadaceae bacterium]|nr:hypothetical protein [Pyrinomonadaceae bacterium]